MSRFFATASDSDSESTSSEEAVLQQRPAINSAAFAFSDDEEETKRVVRSAKEKRYEELNNIIRQIKNYRKNRDMSSMLSGFEDLCKAYQKALPVVQKERNGVTPIFYVRCLSEMEEFITELWEDRVGRKNMSKNSSKSLTTLRQKLRKYNRDFEDDIKKFRENPTVDDDEAKNSEPSEDEGDSDFGPTSFMKETTRTGETEARGKSRTPAAADDDDDDDSIDWGSDSEEEEDSADDETQYASMRDYFLKKTTDGDEEKKKTRRTEKEKEKEKKKRLEEEDDEEGGWKEVTGGIPMAREKPKMFAKDAEINIPMVVKKLNEIIAARGKKGTDRKEMIELLHELLNIAKQHDLGPGVEAKIKFAIIAAIYDYNPMISVAMKPEYWEKVMQKVDELLDMLLMNTDVILGEHVLEDNEFLDKAPYKVRGCMLTVVERLDEEFTKILKECDAHSNEYVERLRDEPKVYQIIMKLVTYIERQGIPSEVCRAYLRRIEHIYYKFDPEVFNKKKDELVGDNETSLDIMNRMCKYIYSKDNTDRIRTRAILSNIYHSALHDYWYEARDLILMSHLQDTIHHSDPPTQILYNRTMVQVGLCAFRHANIRDAHNALLDIQSGGRAKELIAQGLLPQRQHERSTEQEKVEKQRQMPFHMHINLELLECVYLVSAMLMEIPYMAAHEFDARRRMISKSFHHQLKTSERQALVGPPESMREHVVAASKAMRNGDWKSCVNYVINTKMNAKVWDLFYQAEKVKEMLTMKIQEESLRTYLFTYSHVYDTISMVTLMEMFELEYPVVHSIISKMIINEELMGSLDEPTQAVIMHRTEPSRLQSLALQLADKVASLVDNNERMMEMKQGVYFNRNQQGRGFGDRQPYNRGPQQWDRRDRRDNRDDRGGNRGGY